jgi:hypothetical protein
VGLIKYQLCQPLADLLPGFHYLPWATQADAEERTQRVAHAQTGSFAKKKL